jgi:hypothetical protein
MSTEQQRSTKSVTFAETAKVRLTLHINDYSDDEIDACYYSREHFYGFKRDIKRTARMMQMKRKIDENVFCTRGLESRTHAGNKTRSTKRKASVCSVLMEQMKQFRSEEAEGKNCYDDEKIAAMYAPFTRNSTTSAYLTGLSDEMVAREQEQKTLDRPTNNVACQLLKLRSCEGNFQIRREVYNSAA